MEIKEFYLCYTDHMGYRLLEDKSHYDWMIKAAQIMGASYVQVHSDSTKETDPLINTLVIGIEMNCDLAVQIDQGAINWLQDSGRWTFPTAGERA